MNTCPLCAAVAPDSARFCPSCGAAAGDASQTAPPTSPPPRLARAGRSLFLLPEAEERFAPGQILAGRYRIIGLLGRGGMGEVYRADDLKLGLPVALKFLPRNVESDPLALERFHAEVRNARQVSHPHVCRIHDIDEVDGRHFLTMEYVDGEDLATLLRRIGRLPETKAIEFARQVCAGLQAAHDRGVVHRDLKPANVMIDGHGRARITDFGLAVSGPHAAGEVAGTPAYMAPEQLRGEPATPRTDIYALGLLIYEICTGKRPFEASTLVEWQHAHSREAPTSPSRHTREVDPAVERVILWCLEKDPLKRPTSAAQVALALPGGDPLAAAIAAGETPSPEMVAATATEGALRPRAAAAALAGFGMVLAVLVLTSQAHLHRFVPFEKPPEVLVDRASTVIADLGYRVPVVDRAWAYELDQSYMDWNGDPLSGRARWNRIRTGQPLTFFFWYRQSPVSLRPLDPARGTVSRDDPPMQVEGMANVLMDPLGRVVEFTAVPPAIASDAVSATDAPPERWSTLFAAAGLEPQRFRPADPLWTPPVAADRRVAWTGTFADHADLPIRIEAASRDGRPVYFRIAAPWDVPPTAAPAGFAGAEVAAAVIIAVVGGVVLVGAVLLARRNLRLGRGDRPGSTRLAALAGGLAVLSALARSDQPMTLPGVASTLLAAAHVGLLAAAVLWLCYLALEPHVRRHKPQLLVSWTRLLAGDARDPMVGRDILFGSILGLGGASAIWVSGWLKVWTSHVLPPNHYAIPETMNGLRHAVAFMLGQGIVSVWTNLAVLVFLVVMRRLVRREWLAAVALGCTLTAVEILLYARSWPAVTAAAIGWAFSIGTVSRLGLVAGASGGLVYGLVVRFPITSDFSAAYGGEAFVALLATCALAAYGCWVSIGRQPHPVRSDDD